jgi:hypothetical protein
MQKWFYLICVFVVTCCSKGQDPQIQLPNWFNTPKGKIIFISMYLGQDGTFIDPSDNESMRGGLQKIKRNEANVPIMVTTFSYSFYSQNNKINHKKVGEDLSAQIKRYPMCQSGFTVTNIYQGKTKKGNVANVYSGHCNY